MVDQELNNQWQQIGEALSQLNQQQQERAAQLTCASTLLKNQLNQLSQLAIAYGRVDIAANINANAQSILAGFGVMTDRIGGIELAQEITGKARSTLYTLAAAGKIPHAKNGGRLRFTEAALRAYAFQNQLPQTEQ